MRARRESGRSQKLLLLVLIALIGGAGAWNYQRNVRAEQARPRPFRGHADADLDRLLEAYRQERDAALRRFQAASGAKSPIAEGRLLGDQIREFERVQRISRVTRELAARVAEHEASIEQLELEKRRRVEERQLLKLFLRRLLVTRG